MHATSSPSPENGRVRIGYRLWPVVLGTAVVLAQFGVGVAKAAAVVTEHYNISRTGATLQESVLNTTTVAPGKFAKLWTLYANGQVVAQCGDNRMSRVGGASRLAG
jgi:hypothetical protein